MLGILIIFLSCVPVLLFLANLVDLLVQYHKSKHIDKLWHVAFSGPNGYVTIIFILTYAVIFIADYMLKNTNHIMLFLTAGAYVSYLSIYSIMKRHAFNHSSDGEQ